MEINFEKVLKSELQKMSLLCKNKDEDVFEQGADALSVMIILVCLDKLYGVDLVSLINAEKISINMIEREWQSSENSDN